MKNYETACNPRKALTQLVQRPDNETFYARRIADFVVASEINIDANIKAARSLRMACWLTIIAVGTHLLFLVSSALVSESANAGYLGNVILNICLAVAVAFLTVSENPKV